ncbi:MAG TPA: DUF4855 domain-containing protein [Syntrophomonadaceae bacterium]|nr:DUF4855 domain-containing protein [Syntrophomonadaceae bacterium]
MSRKTEFEQIYCDIAPTAGREELHRIQKGTPPLSWSQGAFSLGGSLDKPPDSSAIGLKLKGQLKTAKTVSPAGWIELETSPPGIPPVSDIFVAGSRPLPSPDITCICRHPMNPTLLLAAVKDSRLLFLDSALNANLSITSQTMLPGPIVSMAASGNRIIALSGDNQPAILILTFDRTGYKVIDISRVDLTVCLVALAEDDAEHVWGLNPAGVIYKIQICTAGVGQVARAVLTEQCRLRKKTLVSAGIRQIALSIYRAIRNHNYKLWGLFSGRGAFRSLAYDGRFLWVVRTGGQSDSSHLLSLYDMSGKLLQAFTIWPEAAVSGLGFSHQGLMLLDRAGLRYHHAHIIDSMRPVTGISVAGSSHPGYLPAGTNATAGIHDLCLLYVGGEGSQRVHRYDSDKLRPLVGYVGASGQMEDPFMDGFLLMAQYSPLLNGRAFATDLEGPPSRQEDWIALFDEYFHSSANLTALDTCAAEMARCMPRDAARYRLKVVLALPVPDPRCTDWDQKGTSLADPGRRVEVLTWAMQELLGRWDRAENRRLELVGFYYMTEQGSYDDPVLHAFPRLCRQHGLKSFAIPGITSTWMTEFCRAGFDGVALQPSHAFRKPMGRPPKYWLKCAARIAREYRMGMEIELPYNVLEPTGRAIVMDYLDMARIQGWTGGFKAYFQSYNLIYQLARSDDPACRSLYEDLYKFSRLSRNREERPTVLFQGVLPVEWEGRFSGESGESRFRLNIEGHQGDFQINQLSVIKK